jgi:alkanesulfonate monooxygenase SsuD/methylene tetrahydromethanopterin reductase-like flavin-dependent oxidoreductase (luciferase family)
VKFGIFYEHQLPRPWTEDSEHKLFKDTLDQIELADKLGYDYVWEVEHHFLEEYSHSSAPEVFLAAASQRTSRIRLGHGIVPLPPRYNPTARVAERIATLDLVSDGRVDFGTGETSSQAELEGFGIDRTEKREQWDEALDAVTRMFVESPFAGYHGKYIDMPVREVLPKTLQKPHPPLWVACSRRDTIHLAATKGIGALSFSFVEPDEARMWVNDYYDTIASEACVPGGFAVNANIAVVLPMMCHEDEQTAIDRGLDGAHFFGYSLGHWYAFGEHTLGRTSVYEQFEKNRDRFGFSRRPAAQTGQVLGAQLFERGIGSLRGAVGTPDQLRHLARAYEEVGVDQIIFVSQAGNNRHEHICESMELFAREVMPEFAERADEREKAKLERLAPAIEAALARREPARVAPDTVLRPVFLGS